MNKHRPKSLPDLLKMNRNAITVYAVLRYLGGESRRYATTRQRIADVCGLSLRAIGFAVQALDEAGWLTLNYGREGIKRWYRLTFATVDFLPMVRKTYHSKPKSVSKNIPQQTVCYGTPSVPHTLTGIGRTTPPFIPTGKGVGHAQQTEEHPSARIERERMAEIRKAHEPGTPIETPETVDEDSAALSPNTGRA